MQNRVNSLRIKEKTNPLLSPRIHLSEKKKSQIFNVVLMVANPNPDPHYFRKPNPHWSEKLEPDTH
jgi:hypothetical protein